ncbi:MAG TPA: hypothetical protein VE619_02085 [Nitrososphaeraceae archaeon]|nr:hypothetical protein [Nitrososphaeraceae archaeon]
MVIEVCSDILGNISLPEIRITTAVAAAYRSLIARRTTTPFILEQQQQRPLTQLVADTTIN